MQRRPAVPERERHWDPHCEDRRSHRISVKDRAPCEPWARRRREGQRGRLTKGNALLPESFRAWVSAHRFRRSVQERGSSRLHHCRFLPPNSMPLSRPLPRRWNPQASVPDRRDCSSFRKGRCASPMPSGIPERSCFRERSRPRLSVAKPAGHPMLRCNPCEFAFRLHTTNPQRRLNF